MTTTAHTPPPTATTTAHSRKPLARLTIPIVVLALVLLPFVSPNLYWVHIAALAAVYWILVSGLNLVVGHAGQMAIGHVGLLAVGAYTGCATYTTLGWNPFLSLVAAMVVGTAAGLLIGLPSLRLKRFYFAMATLGFATIVPQLAVVWDGVTGGGLGIAAPLFDGPLGTETGFYWFVLALAAGATYVTWRIARTNDGRGLIAIRDAEVAAESSGVPIFRLKLYVFTLSGALAGLAGALYASLQSYVTPDAFVFDLSMMFFVAVLLGGPGRIAAPLVATVVLTLLPELAAPLAEWSAFLYAALLLAVVLALPNGLGGLVTSIKDRVGRRRVPPWAKGDLDRLGDVLGDRGTTDESARVLSVSGVEKAFGGVRALRGVDLEVAPGQIVGLIGPNGSGKTTLLNIVCGYYPIDEGTVRIDGTTVNDMRVQRRAALGLARCFQSPRVAGDLTVLENVMLGGYHGARTSFSTSMTGIGGGGREARLRERAQAALDVVGLSAQSTFRAELLSHSQLRFLEIARALVAQPRLLLLDEPAAGLSVEEIASLGELIESIAAQGVAVLLVEHHTDLVFDVCDSVTVLDLGGVLAAGQPDDIRRHEEVIHAYLGS